MFQRILRSKHRQRIVLWLLVIAVVVPMLLFFQGSLGGNSPGNAAGVIFGRTVPRDVFQQEYLFTHAALERQFGELPEELAPLVQQQAWDRLILREVARKRLRVTDAEVAGYLRKQPAFQIDGRFDQALYERWARGMGSTPRVFEERVRDDLRIQGLIEQLNAEVQLTEEELRAAYDEAFTQLSTALFLVKASAFDADATASITEEDLRAAYDRQQEALRQPATRTIDYIGLSLADTWKLAKVIPTEELQAYYDAHRDAFAKEDGTVPPMAEVEAMVSQGAQEARGRAQLADLAADLEDARQEGQTFDEIAAIRRLPVRSTGPVARNAGDIPNGPRRAMIEEAFETPLGAMTRALETPGGAYLLRPTSEMPAGVPPFEEVNESLRQTLRDTRARERAKARALELREQVIAKRQEGFTFQESCLLLSLELLQPPPFTRKGPMAGLGRVPDADALFGLQPGDVSQPLDAPQGAIVVFVNERIPFDPAQLERDREAFRARLLAAKQQAHLNDRMAQFRQDARLKSFLEPAK